MSNKQIKETVDHLIATVHAIVMGLEKGPAKNIAQSRLEKIHALYHPAPTTNIGDILNTEEDAMIDAAEKSVAVSDGEVKWGISDSGVITRNGVGVGNGIVMAIPAFRTLIAREKLLDKVMGRIKMRTPITHKDLIAEYEEAVK